MLKKLNNFKNNKSNISKGLLNFLSINYIKKNLLNKFIKLIYMLKVLNLYKYNNFLLFNSNNLNNFVYKKLKNKYILQFLQNSNCNYFKIVC
jgi:hypothetical protein